MTTTAAHSQVLMARQPIFDCQQRVVAYELLYRNEADTEHALFNDSSATCDVILNVYTSIADNGSKKSVPAFINMTRDLLVSEDFPELPRKQIVIEVLEDIAADDEVIAAVTRLAEKGYRIALDDFVYSPEFDPLLKLAHIVKVDVLGMSPDDIARQVKLLRPFNVTLLAEKIETVEVLEHCHALGFKLFQGHFLSKPKLIKGRKLEANHANLLVLVSELQNKRTTPERLEELIIQDPVLTYKLLRIVNSAAYSLIRRVESLSEAIVLLGMDQIRSWATMIALANRTSKPEEICRSLLLRGKMCEAIARSQGCHNDSSYFMTGVLSQLHVMLDIDQKTMLEQVPLGEDIESAIKDHAGSMGDILKHVTHYEAGDWDLLPNDIDIDAYEESYRAALDWSKDAMLSMST
ncbi:EAL and HDOD domain-containing protein [Aliamphritea hakodatensis]|uniref:EAL and HDOD domain-containing protein n=1 Tax=Aliamphritea hakodatensis TaxID=2895352 RepID=UPI0022FD97B1|nr:HDOD domain-containing protein [Aliamphritea hakodatensis]